WYPHDVWLHVLAADWVRVEQELPFVGRTGQRGDDLGSRLIAARLVATLVRLAFLVERCWPPYPKWAGTLFARLPVAATAGGRRDVAGAGRGPARGVRRTARAAAVGRPARAGRPGVRGVPRPPLHRAAGRAGRPACRRRRPGRARAAAPRWPGAVGRRRRHAHRRRRAGAPRARLSRWAASVSGSAADVLYRAVNKG